jgi:hypothetical protein
MMPYERRQRWSFVVRRIKAMNKLPERLTLIFDGD